MQEEPRLKTPSPKKEVTKEIIIEPVLTSIHQRKITLSELSKEYNTFRRQIT